ncbi:cell division protein ZapA [uncultured Psychrobacter sp.]|uniref:cell division protein ZapA n=1 Tax=uncultured Psychrobacter sp. TaxID=259303 RepID=UPI003459E6C4
MTDNNSSSAQNDKSSSAQNPNINTPKSKDNTQSTTVQTIAPSRSVDDAVNVSASNTGKKSATASKPQMKKVDIVIAGVTYQIYCPVDEEAELRSAVYYINNFLLDIKKDAPGLSQENLLVLCCLNLYEKIHTNDKTNATNKQQSKQAEELLNKIMKDAKSIL